MNHQQKPFTKAGVIGLAMEVLLLAGMALLPFKSFHLPQGFFTPIIAFEFGETVDEVDTMFKTSDDVIQWELVASMDTINQFDFVYMTLYSIFLTIFSIVVAKQSGRKIFYFTAALSVIVLLADLMENLQLLGITSKISSGEFEAELARLHLFPWLKWG